MSQNVIDFRDSKFQPNGEKAMNKNSTFKLLALVGVALILSACGKNDLSREKASEILNNVNAKYLASECALDKSLIKKPEFHNLSDKPICKTEMIVTGLQKVSDTEVVVEAKQVTQNIDSSIQEWIEAFNSMERRLQSLQGTRVYSKKCSRNIWVFKDDSDEQFFTTYANRKTPSISDSHEWSRLQNLKRTVMAMSKIGDAEGYKTYYEFKLFDDGWRFDNSMLEHSERASDALARDLALFSASKCRD